MSASSSSRFSGFGFLRYTDCEFEISLFDAWRSYCGVNRQTDSFNWDTNPGLRFLVPSLKPLRTVQRDAVEDVYCIAAV